MPRFPRPAMAAHLEAICPDWFPATVGTHYAGISLRDIRRYRPEDDRWPVRVSHEEDLLLRYGNLFAHVIGPRGEKRGD